MSEDFFSVPVPLGPKRPTLLQIVTRDRRAFAERTGWPDGALEACERIEQEYADWRISWLPANPVVGYERPACFWARREWPHHEVYGADPAELVAEIELAPQGSMFSRYSG